MPKAYAFVNEGDVFSFLVMQLCGKSLQKLFDEQTEKVKKFSMKTVCMLAIQLIERMKMLHENNLLHRDIKPDNFVMGYGEEGHVVYMIDYGLAKHYRDPKTKQHISEGSVKSMLGTARYAPINAHLMKEQSRRDDLEAIGYMLIYFLKGKLPWQSDAGEQKKQNEKDDKYKAIGDKK